MLSLYSVMLSLFIILCCPSKELFSFWCILLSLYCVLLSLCSVLLSLHSILVSLHSVLFSLHNVLLCFVVPVYSVLLSLYILSCCSHHSSCPTCCQPTLLFMQIVAQLCNLLFSRVVSAWLVAMAVVHSDSTTTPLRVLGVCPGSGLCSKCPKRWLDSVSVRHWLSFSWLPCASLWCYCVVTKLVTVTVVLEVVVTGWLGGVTELVVVGSAVSFLVVDVSRVISPPARVASGILDFVFSSTMSATGVVTSCSLVDCVQSTSLAISLFSSAVLMSVSTLTESWAGWLTVLCCLVFLVLLSCTILTGVIITYNIIMGQAVQCDEDEAGRPNILGHLQLWDCLPFWGHLQIWRCLQFIGRLSFWGCLHIWSHPKFWCCCQTTG